MVVVVVVVDVVVEVVVDVGTVVVVVDVVVEVVVDVGTVVVVVVDVVVVEIGTGTEHATPVVEVATAELSSSGERPRTVQTATARSEPRRNGVDGRRLTMSKILAGRCESCSPVRRKCLRVQDDVVKATTRFEVGASRRLSPRPGVAKWLATGPTVTRRRTVPVAGSRP